MRTRAFSTLTIAAFGGCALLIGTLARPVLAETPEQALNAEARRIDSLAASQGQSQVAGKIIAEFQSFAGSYSNASSLLTGLRQGGAIALTKAKCAPVSFAPSTGKIGYGEAFITLSVARQKLAGAGVSQPCPEQIMAVLLGEKGILKLRSQGMGWGKIADSLGINLERAVDAMNSAGKDTDQSSSATKTGDGGGTGNPKDTEQIGGTNQPGAGGPTPGLPGIGIGNDNGLAGARGCEPGCARTGSGTGIKGRELDAGSEKLRDDFGAAGSRGVAPQEVAPGFGQANQKSPVIRPGQVNLPGALGRDAGIRPDVRSIDPARPEVRPEVVRPEVVRPEVVRPEVVRPEVVRPEVVRPELVRPEFRPEVVRPELVRPEVVRPELVRPEVVRPELVRPEVRPEAIVRPETIRPELLRLERLERGTR